MKTKNVIRLLLPVLIITSSLSYSRLSSRVSRLDPAPINIPGIFNTGLDEYSNLLPEGSIDPHYQLIVSADKIYTGPDAKVVNYAGFPMDCWLPNSDRSLWIAPRNDAGEFNDAGVYVYRITFDLTKFKANTAVITGIWSTDNSGVDILINGKSTGYITPSNAFRFGFFAFEINSGFEEKINTIDFVVHNISAPTGIRVEITGKAEPKEYVMNFE